MGHMSTIYLHCHDAAHFQHIEADFLASGFHDAPSSYIGIPQRKDTPLDRHLLGELSDRYATEAIGLRCASNVFEFLLYREGKLIRHLRYTGPNAPDWNTADGDAQPWETALFEQPVSDTEPGAIHHPIQAGQRSPVIHPDAAARALAVYYRLSGWRDDWETAGGQQAWWKVW